MKVLAILYCYPPLLVPASICYAKLMTGLHANGVDVEIVTITPDTFVSPGPIPLDDSLLPHLPALTNHVVRSPETSLLVRTLKRVDPERRFTARWLEPRKREWTFPASRQLRALDLDRYDVLLTCSQPHANHLLGLELKRRSGLPWVAYFSDPWTNNPYAAYSSGRLRDHHRRLEAQVLEAADHVLFTCEEMRELTGGTHPGEVRERSGVLPHAFVPDWYGLGRAVPKRESGPRLRLLQTGSFYGPRTPMPLLESLDRVRRQIPLDGALRIDVYGGMDPRHRERIEQMGLGEIVAVHGFIPYLDSLSLMAAYDGLLLVDAPLSGMTESVFLPSKLIDYLGSGSPVVAMTPGRGATARVVRETGGTVCALERPAELDRFLLGAVEEGAAAGTPREDAVAAYDYRTVARSLERCMAEVVSTLGAGHRGA